jgi:hypothetical protein
VALVGIQLTIRTNKKQKPTNKDISEHENMYRTNTFIAMIIDFDLEDNHLLRRIDHQWFP